MMRRLTAFLCLGIISLAAGSGCSFFAKTNSSTRENISVSEQVKNSSCTATVSVSESINGKSAALHQASVPCANTNAVQARLTAQAKQGL